MKPWKVIVFGACLFSATLMTVAQPRTVGAQQGGEAVADSYEVVPNWPQPLSPDLDWTRTSSVFAESPNRVFVLQTGQAPKSWRTSANHPILLYRPNWPHRPYSSQGVHVEYTPGKGQVQIDSITKEPIPGSRWAHLLNVFDAQGKLVESWEQHNHRWIHPHALLIDPNDPERHVWTGDTGTAQVLKFSNDGKKVVLELGVFRNNGRPKHEGLDDQVHFGGVSAMAFGANGELYVADTGSADFGHNHQRIVKFSKDGKFLMEIGKRGTGPGEFDRPDSIDVDSQGRIYVADGSDATDGRIQVFDKNGKYLRQTFLNLELGEHLDTAHPHTIALSKDEEYLYVVVGGPAKANEIRTYTLDGKFVSSWGKPLGGQPGQIWGLHDFSVATDGSLYIAESYGGRAWKYRPKSGADQKSLFRPLKKNSF